MNRRQLLCAGASSLAALALRSTPLRAAAAAYDLVIQDGDTKDLANADVAAAKAAIAKHRDIIVGVKARLSANVTGPNDIEVLKRAQDVATSFSLPVMIHMGQSFSPLPALINQLKR